MFSERNTEIWRLRFIYQIDADSITTLTNLTVRTRLILNCGNIIHINSI